MDKDRADLMDACDTLFSHNLAGIFSHCLLCNQPDTDTAHVIGRTYKVIRFDYANAVRLCRKCHRYYTDDTVAWNELIERILPKRWDYLQSNRLKYVDIDIIFLTELYAKLKADTPDDVMSQSVELPLFF